MQPFAFSRNHASTRVITHTRLINTLFATRQFSSPAGAVREGDTVLLKRLARKDSQVFTKPLKHGRKVQTHFGDVPHSDIIGKQYREIVKANTGSLAQIQQPTLAEYVTLTPRNVTPVYPDDANLIVSLLDIHVSPSSDENVPKLEILEAGTGHGSLTLHLARAVHAANPPPAVPWDESTQDGENAMLTWKENRAAVIHTIDRSQIYSDAARKVVAGFRNAIYAGHVDFHVGNVSDFIATKVNSTGSEQVFSHVILDLPDVQLHVPASARALRNNGVLIVFCPSVTQVASCVATIREQRLPLEFIQVLELGTGCNGGKRWDLRAVKLRNPDNGQANPLTGSVPEAEKLGLIARLFRSVAKFFFSEASRSKPPPAERWEMVCRPSVGHRVVGGGFVGMWRRKSAKESNFQDNSQNEQIDSAS